MISGRAAGSPNTPEQTGVSAMKRILTAIAASVCAMPILSAAPGDSPVGSGIMDDLFTPYDDTAIELPGESEHRPSVSRSAQLVDDSARDTWGARDDGSSSSSSSSSSSKSSSKSSSGKTSSTKSSSSSSSSSSKTTGSGSRSTSSSFSGSKSFNADGSYIPYSERYPEQEKEKSDSGFDRNTFDPNFKPFKNNYEYGDTNYNPNGTRPEYEETRRKIKDIIGSVPKVMTDDKVGEMIHNPARAATLEAPTTPNRWTHAPNSWFCDYDDVMEKAQQTGKAVAIFFHSSTNDNSRKFKTERMENSKFKSKMRDRLLILYMDYPENAGTSKDRRNREQVEHNRRIADQFHVSNYPTVIFLNSSGKELGRVSDMKTITEFVENADRIVPQREAKEKNSTGFKAGGSLNGEGRQSGSQSSRNDAQNGQNGGFDGGFPQGGFPQGGFPQGGFPQGGFPQGGFGGMGN